MSLLPPAENNKTGPYLWLLVVGVKLAIHEGDWFARVYVMVRECHVSLGVVEADHDEPNAAYQLLLEGNSTKLGSLHRTC